LTLEPVLTADGTVTYAAVVTEYPLEALLAALDDVAAEGTAFDAEQENGLCQKTHQVSVKVASGRVYQACQELQAFLCQLEALRGTRPGTWRRWMRCSPSPMRS